MARIMMLSGVAMASVNAPAWAGVWRASGQSQVSARYEDNVRLSVTNEVAAASGVVDLSANVLYRNDAFQWRLTPRFLASRYDGEPALDRTEQYVSMLFLQAGQRSSSQLTLSGTQDTTLTSELGLTGLSEVNKRHRTWSVNAARSHNVTQRLAATVQLSASANYYIDAEQTGLLDYNYGSVMASGSYDLSKRSKVSLQASAGKLQVPDIEAYDKTNQAITLGYDVQLASRWRGKLSYGPSWVKGRNASQQGSVYDASISRASQWMDLGVTLGRDVIATGRGTLTRREQVRLNLSKSFNERWSTAWSIAATRNQDFVPQDVVADDSVLYADLTGSVSWRASPTWNFSLSAGYARQDIDTNNTTAERRHAALNVTWSGLSRRLH